MLSKGSFFRRLASRNPKLFISSPVSSSRHVCAFSTKEGGKVSQSWPPLFKEEPLRIFLVAGEPSGDAIGSQLMVSLRKVFPTNLVFQGVGGPWMQEQGLRSVFPMDDISVMGLAEVAFRLPLLWARLRQTVAAASAFAPHVVVTIDSKGFSFRALRGIREACRAAGRQAPVCVHYVAPSYWAWKGGLRSLQNLHKIVDHVLCVLPWEPATCREHGVRATFVGHPAMEDVWNARHRDATTRMCINNNDAICHALETGHEGVAPYCHVAGNGAAFRAAHGLPPDPWPSGGPVVGVLGGSRVHEVRRMMPIFGAALRHLASQEPFQNLSVVLPTVPASAVEARVRRAAEAWGLPCVVVPASSGGRAKYDVLAACDVALSVSGTAVCQLMLAGLPCAVAYKAHPLTQFFARRWAQVKHVSLPNIMEGREAIPEAVFEACTPSAVSAMLRKLLLDKRHRNAQLDVGKSVLPALAAPASCSHCHSEERDFNQIGATGVRKPEVHQWPCVGRPSMAAAHAILEEFSRKMF